MHAGVEPELHRLQSGEQLRGRDVAVSNALPADLNRPVLAARRFHRRSAGVFVGHPDRGAVLRKTGVKHKFRIRFMNPLMQPLVITKGMVDGRIDAEALKRIRDEARIQ